MPPSDPPKQSQPVSIRRLADLLGTSRSTVSRAFRADASIRPELRERILEAAGRSGYRPDPMVTELMSSFARRQTVDYRETLGVLWWPDRWNQTKAPASFAQRLRLGLESEAEKHGCRLTQFVLEKASVPALARTLSTRRIRGLIITPPSEPGLAAPALDWSGFSVVTIGRSLGSPSFNCAHHNHYSTMVQVLRRLRERGFRRPVLLAQVGLEERMQRAYTGAFLAHEAGPPEHVLHMGSADPAGLAQRLRAIAPDVIIADVEEWAESLRALPPSMRRTSFVALDVSRRQGPISGVHQNVVRMAGAAIQLLMQARFQGETGVPVEPVSLQTPGEWIEGETLGAARKTG